MLSHTLLSAILLGAIFMIGVSAYHLKRNQHVEIFMRSVKVAVIVGLIASLLIPIEGNSYSKYIGQNDVQPLKGAILRNKIESPAQTEIKVTEGNGKESQIDANSAATLDSAAADLQKLDRKPPVKAIYFGFMLMQGLGFFFIAFFAILFIRRKLLLENKFIQNLAIWTMPLPYTAITVGWFVAEVGRQPWMVYNLMTVEAGVSDVPVGAVIFSLFTLVVFYAILFAIDFYLLRKKVIEGPEEEGGDYHVAA
jgi:cytochrome d ubiquinol oxidase subunit I